MILSQVPRGELARALRGPGVRVRTGPVIACVRSPLATVAAGLALHYADHPVERSDGFADFHVRVDSPAGIRRWVRPQVMFHFDGDAPFKPLPLDQAFPMLEWGLNWCVSAHCHQYLIVHAAAVERNGRACILPAPPGSGKSTLTAALVSRGWTLLSDELTLIERGTGDVVPLPRPISLKNASIEVIRRFSERAVLGPVVHDTVKGAVAHMKPPVASVRRADRAARPGWIVLPQYEPGARAQLLSLPKSRAFMRLADNAFNYSLHGRRGFELLAGVVDVCACYDFSYSELSEAVAIFDALAEGHEPPT